DLVVLDLMLPGASGYDVLAELRRREETKELGVIVLTARKDESDRIKGLSLGADDYLPKPFSPQELVLRVAAVLRRLAAPAVAAGGLVTAGPIVVDRHAHRVTVSGADVELTATEFKLLTTLIEREGRVQSRAQLLETVWQAQPDIQTRTVDMHVQRLRQRPRAGGAADRGSAAHRFAPLARRGAPARRARRAPPHADRPHRQGARRHRVRPRLARRAREPSHASRGPGGAGERRRTGNAV